MTLLDGKVKDKYKTMILASLNRIEVKPGNCRWNFRCQRNAVHEAVLKGEKSIAMVFSLEDEDYPIIHFLNVSEDGSFVDNTLGVWVETHEYFLVRYIPESDFFKVNDIFTAYRKELRSTLPWWVRLFSEYEA